MPLSSFPARATYPRYQERRNPFSSRKVTAVGNCRKIKHREKTLFYQLGVQKSPRILTLKKKHAYISCLALQVGEEDPPTKNLTKKKPHILRPVLDAAEMILQFFLGLLACIFR